MPDERLDAGAGSVDTQHELPVLLGAGAGAVETLMLVGPPGPDGMVHVRAWTAGDWSAAPRSRVEKGSELLAWLEAQSRVGRSLNQSLYAVRLWLRGAQDPTR